jgi:hypothetical protein
LRPWNCAQTTATVPTQSAHRPNPTCTQVPRRPRRAHATLPMNCPPLSRPWDHRRPRSHATHGFTALPLVSSTTLPYPPLQVEAKPFSSCSCSPPLALLYHPRAHSTRHRQPLATTDERRLKHHHPRAPSDSSDRAFVHPRATSPCPEDCRGRQSSASFIHRHLAVDSCLWPSFGPPNSSSRTPALP